jgi:hypothetical protein
VLPNAIWHLSDDESVQITQDGRVVEDGDVVFVLDRVGRVTDEDHEPIAVLLPDGIVAATDNRHFGRVGVTNAAPPGSPSAWLSLLPDGTVVYFDDEGERRAGGVWSGCRGPALRTCTLVSHLFRMRSYAGRSQGGPSFGIGLGIGVYR